jgi:hypothetical protein
VEPIPVVNCCSWINLTNALSVVRLLENGKENALVFENDIKIQIHVEMYRRMAVLEMHTLIYNSRSRWNGWCTHAGADFSLKLTLALTFPSSSRVLQTNTTTSTMPTRVVA